MRTGLNAENLPPATRLRALKVGQKTLNRYLTCIKEFEAWCRGQGRKVTDAQLDRHVTAYITHLYDHDFDLSAAAYTIYGLQLLRCNDQRGLAGWSQAKLSGVAQDESWEDEDASPRRVPMGFGDLGGGGRPFGCCHEPDLTV